MLVRVTQASRQKVVGRCGRPREREDIRAIEVFFSFRNRSRVTDRKEEVVEVDRSGRQRTIGIYGLGCHCDDVKILAKPHTFARAPHFFSQAFKRRRSLRINAQSNMARSLQRHPHRYRVGLSTLKYWPAQNQRQAFWIITAERKTRGDSMLVCPRHDSGSLSS